MASNRRHTKTPAALLPDPKLLADNDARIAEAKALASTEAPDRDNLGRFVVKNPVVMPEPPRAGQPALAPRSSGRRKAAAKAVVPVAAVALPQPYDHPLNQRGSGAQVLEVTDSAKEVTPEQQPEVLPPGVRVTPGDPRPRFFIDEHRKNKLRERTFNAAFGVVISLFLIAMFGIVLYEIYKRY